MHLSPSLEKSALISTFTRGDRSGNIGHGHGGRSVLTSDDRDRLKCEHCSWYRHTKEQCCDLNGHPHDSSLLARWL